MFDKKDMQAYRSIVVPSGLKQRIERDYAEKQSKPRVIGGSRLARFALPMAACLVLLCTVFMYLPSGAPVALSYDGVNVTEQGVALGAAQARSALVTYSDATLVDVTLLLNAKDPCLVRVSAGTLILLKSETVLAANEEKEIKGKCEILWTLDENCVEPFELYLRTDGETLTYVLTFDESVGGYVIYQK